MVQLDIFTLHALFVCMAPLKISVFAEWTLAKILQLQFCVTSGTCDREPNMGVVTYKN